MSPGLCHCSEGTCRHQTSPLVCQTAWQHLANTLQILSTCASTAPRRYWQCRTPYGPLWENKTPSTKLEVYKYCCQRKNEPQVTRTENFQVFLDTWVDTQTDNEIQTYRHAIANTLRLYRTIDSKLQLRLITLMLQSRPDWCNLLHNNNDRFTALCPGLPGWAGTRRNTHPPPSWSSSNLSASSIYHDA